VVISDDPMGDVRFDSLDAIIALFADSAVLMVSAPVCMCVCMYACMHVYICFFSNVILVYLSLFIDCMCILGRGGFMILYNCLQAGWTHYIALDFFVARYAVLDSQVCIN
jgi:hypothetical protein